MSGLERRAVAIGALAVVLAVALGGLAGARAGAVAGALTALAGLASSAVLTVAVDRQAKHRAAAAKRRTALRDFAPPGPSAGDGGGTR